MTHDLITTLPSRFAALLGIPLLIAATAFAQDPAPGTVTNAAAVDPAANANAPTGGAATTERVIVTGSYIPTAETESALPVTVYTAEVLQKQGAQTPVEGLRQLPSFVGNAVTENDSNGGNGQATINLRAIGAQNTLVLVNGRRAFLGVAANAGTIGGGADINAIPLGATARTEVLKDGASAIYGSDAVGGVVNFVLLNGPGEAPYEGAEIFLLYGNTTEADEHVRQGYIRGGVKTDKVAIAAAGEYYSKANLFSRDRAKLAGSGDLRSTATPGEMGLNPPGIGPLGRGGLNNNSPTFSGRVNVAPSQAPIDANGNPVNIDLPPEIPNAVPASLPAQGGQLVLSDLFENSPDDADYRRFDVPGGSDPARFNFRAFTPSRPGLERANYYISGRYKVFGDAMQVYGDVMYTAARQDNALAPAPFTIPLGGYSNASVIVPYQDPRRAPGTPFGAIAAPAPGTPPVSFGQFSAAAQRAIIQNSVFNPIAGRDVFRPADLPGQPTGNINPLTGLRASRPARYITPPGALTTMAYRLVQELGNRRSLYDSDYHRYVGGINGDLNFQGNNFISRFGYDTGFIYEQFEQRRTDSGDARRGTIYNEIIAGNFNPFIGQNAPAVGTAMTYLNGAPTGVLRPYDNVAAAQRAAFIARSFTYERDWLVDAKVNAHFFPNLYNGGFDMAAGYEHREHREQSIPDPTQLAADQLGFNAASSYHLKTTTDSVFFEMTFPIVTSTMNIPFVRSLEVSAAWRYEKFTLRDQNTHNQSEFNNRNPDEDFGGTPRVSLRYQPIADLTLRANFNQSFRAPTAFGLFSPLQQNFPSVFDPFGPLGGLTLQPPNGVFQGGNLDLIPEKTDSYSAGIVYTPKWLPGFTITADYYQLYTVDVLLGAASAAQVLLSLNFPDPDAPQGGGNGITRNPDGTLASIDSVVDNAGRRFVQGMDVTAVYEIPTQNLGTFTISAGLNHFFTYKVEPLVGFGYHNFLGDFSSSFPLTPGAVPFNKGFVRGEWAWKGVTLNATFNYIGDYEDDPNFITGNTQTPESTLANPAFVLHHRVSSYETLDLNLSYEFIKPQMEPAAGGYSKDAKDAKSQLSQVAGVENNGSFLQRMLWGTRVTVGVNNVFDRYPPTVLGAFNDNYDTSLYNIRNRYYYISLNKKF